MSTQRATALTVTPFTVAITGASRGIGADIARYLATHVAAISAPGAPTSAPTGPEPHNEPPASQSGRTSLGEPREAALRLVLVARDARALDELAAELASTSRRVEVTCIAADLADVDHLDDVAEQLWSAFDGGLDALVNNAGISITGPATAMTAEDWQSVITMNLSSPALLAAAIGRRMAERGGAGGGTSEGSTAGQRQTEHEASDGAASTRRGGRIVNVTSVAGSRALAEHYAYCSSKAGLIMATKVLATELGAAGVRVNSVSPTVVLTEMGTRVWGDEAKAAPMLARIATGHFAQPEDVAAAVAYLLSPGAEMVTGHDLVVDGGFSAI